jgi:hypothetical protein
MEEMIGLLKYCGMYALFCIPAVCLAFWAERRENARKQLAFAEFRQRLLEMFPDAEGIFWQGKDGPVYAIQKEIERKYRIPDMRGFAMAWPNGASMRIYHESETPPPIPTVGQHQPVK